MILFSFILSNAVAFAGPSYYESYARYKTEVQRSAEQNPKATVEELRAQNQSLWLETERLRRQQDKESAKTTMNAVLKGALLNEIPKPVKKVDKETIHSLVQSLPSGKMSPELRAKLAAPGKNKAAPAQANSASRPQTVASSSSSSSSRAPSSTGTGASSPAKPGGAKKINFGTGKAANGTVSFGENRGDSTNFREGRGEHTDFKKPTDAGIDFYTDKDGE